MPDEEEEVQANGMGVVDGGATAEAKVQVREVDVGQLLVGTVGTLREGQEVEVHSSKAAAKCAHWMTGERVGGFVEESAVGSAPIRPG